MKSEHAQEALHRAMANQSMANFLFIIEGFMEKGIDVTDIHPRENVFTFHAWKALGRVVKKGEHGVKVVTFVQSTKLDKDGKFSKYPKMTTVFHISQTELIDVPSN